MKPKSSRSRDLEADIVRLHHATGRQRDELTAKLIYEVLKETTKPAKRKKTGNGSNTAPND